MLKEKLVKLNPRFKKRISWLLAVIFFVVVCVVFSAVGLTRASFTQNADRTIDLNFKNEAVNIDAVLKPDVYNAYGDITLLKMFNPSEEASSVNLVNNAQITIEQSAIENLMVRFKMGFEVYGNATLTSSTMQTIVSYLNQTVEMDSNVALNPYGNYKWQKQSDNYYYLVDPNNENNKVQLKSMLGDYTLKIISDAIIYNGIEELNLTISNQDKTLFDKLAFVMQVEVAEATQGFTYAAPRYVYGKVAVFDSNDGSPVQAILTTNNSVSLPNATKNGYSLDGWYDSQAYASLVGSNGEQITQEEAVCTYYAKFEPNKYTVTLNPNGGRVYGQVSNYMIQDIVYGENFLSSPAVTEKNGHTFLGYYDANNQCYIDEKGLEVRSWDKEASATLTARYSNPAMYDIVYQGLDDTCFFVYNSTQTTPTIQYTYGSNPITIPNPAKPGYNFIGWNVNGAETLVTTYQITPTTYGRIYLKANFSPIQYTATIEGESTSIGFSYETPLVLPALTNVFVGYQVVSTSNNWSVTGTSVNAFVVDEIYPGGTPILQRYGDVVFKKAEKVENAIIFDAQADEAYVEPMAILRTTTAKVTLPNAYRTNYIFNGWYYDSACTASKQVPRQYQIDVTKFENNDFRLFAKWTPGTDKYTVTLHNGEGQANGTLIYNLSSSKNSYTVSSRSPVPTKQGYTFIGYYTKENGLGEKFYDANGSSLVRELTSIYLTDYSHAFHLYAAYVENVYKLEFVTNGGESLTPIYYTSLTESIAYPKASKFGYEFAGWQITSQTGNWDTGNVDAGTTISTSGKYGNVVLQAIYTPIEYKITLHSYTVNGTNINLATSTINYTIESVNIILPTQTITGHDFQGWEVGSGFGSWANAKLLEAGTKSINSTYYGDVELFAKCSLKVYTIKFKYVSATGTDLTNTTYEFGYKDAVTGEYKEAALSYASSSQPVYFTYKNKTVTLRNTISATGVNCSVWTRENNNIWGKWNASFYNSGAVVTLDDAGYFPAGTNTTITLVSKVTTLFDSGTGTANNPYIIKNVIQLRNLSTIINDELMNPNYKDLNYALGADINFTPSDAIGSKNFNGKSQSYNFTAIGYDAEGRRFEGIFDGRGHRIIGLATMADKKASSGLFGCIAGATIQNVILQEPKICSSFDCVGALVSKVNYDSMIDNCHVKSVSTSTTSGGSIYYIDSLASSVGAIVGEGRGCYIKSCSNEINIQSTGTQTGGVIGGCYDNSVVLDASNKGDVRIYRKTAVTTNNWDCGGVIGKLGASTKADATKIGSCLAMNLYNAGNVTIEANVNGTDANAGVVGYKGFNSFVFNAYNEGIFKYIAGASNTTGQTAVIGAYMSADQNNSVTAPNGLLNLYYSTNTNQRVANNTTSYLNENNNRAHVLTLDQITGKNENNVVTDYSVFRSKSFASLPTLMNVWVYDLQSLTGIYPPIHYNYGNAEHVIYNDLMSYLSSLGIELEEVHYWSMSSSSAFISYESRLNSNLAIKYIDLGGGQLYNGQSTVFSKLVQNGSTIYADSEKIYVDNFARAGYKFIGLSTEKDGSDPLKYLQQLGSTNKYYEINMNDVTHGVVTYYAIWGKSFAEGSGTDEDPYIITSGEQLAELAQLINSASQYMDTNGVMKNYSEAVYHQPQNIHLENVANWQPIGIGSSDTTYFKGKYYGYNSYIYVGERTFASNNVGIFGATNGATIRNVRVSSNDSISGQNNTGGLIGYSKSTLIDTCSVEGISVYGIEAVGGLIGRAENSTIVNCLVVSPVKQGTNHVGSMVGFLHNSQIFNFVVGGTNICRVTDQSASASCGAVVGTSIGSTIKNGYTTDGFAYLSGDEYITTHNENVEKVMGRIVGSCVTSRTTIANVYVLKQRIYTECDKYAYVGKSSNLSYYTLTDVCDFREYNSNNAEYGTYKLTSIVNIGGTRCSYLFEALNVFAEKIAPPTNALYTYEYIGLDFVHYNNETYGSQNRLVAYCLNVPSDVSLETVKWNVATNYVVSVDVKYQGVMVDLPLDINGELSIPIIAGNAFIFTGWYTLEGVQLTVITGTDAQGVPTQIAWLDGANVIYENELYIAHWKAGDGSLSVEAINAPYSNSPIELCTSSYKNTGNSATDVHYNVGESPATASSGTIIPTQTNVGTYKVWYYQKINGKTYQGYVQSSIIARSLQTGAVADAIANQVYTGGSIEPNFLVRDFNNAKILEPGRDYIIVEWLNNIQVGQATIVIKGQGNYNSDTLEIHFNIIPASNDVVVTPRTITYNNEDQVLVGMSGAHGEVYYAIAEELNAQNYGSRGSRTLPRAKNAGTYVVHWYCVGSAGFEDSFGSVSVTIAPRNLQDIPEEGITGLVSKEFTGYPIYQNFKIFDTALTGSPELGVEDYGYSYDLTTNTNVGTAKINLTGKNNNYTGNRIITFEITKSTSSIIVYGVTVTYTYLPQIMAGIVDSGNHYTVYFGTQELTASNYLNSQISSTAIPTRENAGQYTFYYFAQSTEGNYEPISGSFTSIINPADIGGAFIEPVKNQTYTGGKITPKPVVKFNNKQVESEDFTYSWANNTNATNNAIVAIVGKRNFTGSNSREFKIVKQENTISINAPTSALTYNGEEQALVVVSNSLNKGKVYFNLNSEASAACSTDIPKGIDAGTYLVYYYCEGTKNYSSKSGVVEVTIARSENTVIINTISGLVYNNQNQDLITGVTTIGDVYYSTEVELKFENYTTAGVQTIPQKINAGTYTVYCYVAQSKNYKETTGSASVSIAPRDIKNAKIAPINDFIYTGNELKPEITVTDFNDSLVLAPTVHFKDPLSDPFAYENNVDVGTATIRIEGINNYAGSKETTFQIKSQMNTVAVTAKTGLKYNNQNQDLITVNDSGAGKLYYSIGIQLTTANYATEGAEYNPLNKKPQGINAGEYVVYYYSAGTSYVSAAWGSVTVNIAKRDLDYVTISGLHSMEYTGGPLTQSYTVKDMSLVDKPELHLNQDFTEFFSDNVMVGSNATLLITAMDSSNYFGTQIATFEITKQSNTANVTAKTGLFYNGSQLELVTTSGSIGAIHFNIGSAATASSPTNIPTGVNAGTYKVYWFSEGDDNYASTSGWVDVEIGKRILDKNNVQISGYSDVTYTGSVKTFTLNIKDIGLNHVLSQTTEVSVQYTGNTNPGTAKILVSARANTNYITPNDIEATFTIRPATITTTGTLPTYSFEYDGLEHSPVAEDIKNCFSTVNNQPITISYRSGGGHYSTNLPKFADIGAYTIELRITANNHEERVGQDVITLTIGVGLYNDPTNLRWSGANACWDAIESPDGSTIYYNVILFNGSAQKIALSVSDTYVDFTSYMVEESDNWLFTVQVVATANYAASSVVTSSNTSVYKISYNANGGNTASVPKAHYKVYGVSVSLSDKEPSFYNKTFIGWNTNSNALSASYRRGATYSTNSSITLYAIWQITFTFTYSGEATASYHEDKVARYSTTRLTSEDAIGNASLCTGLSVSSSGKVSGSYTMTEVWTPGHANIEMYIYLGNSNNRDGFIGAFHPWYGHKTSATFTNCSFGYLETIGNTDKGDWVYDHHRYYYKVYSLTISGNGQLNITAERYED